MGRIGTRDAPVTADDRPAAPSGREAARVSATAWSLIVAALMVSACDAGRAGESAFNQRCLGCHTLSEIGQRLAGRPAADCVRHLERFLAQHHAPDPAEREAILAWLNAQLCRQD